MAEGEVTSRQDGGVHTWDVGAAAVGDGMTRSVVRRSYLRLRARATGPRPGSGLCARSHEAVNAQYRLRRGRLQRSLALFRPTRDGK
jgi:hypothetical protein